MYVELIMPSPGFFVGSYFIWQPLHLSNSPFNFWLLASAFPLVKIAKPQAN